MSTCYRRAVPEGELTALLSRASAGDRAAANEVAPLVYAELRRRAAALMRRETSGDTLQVTGLVHEAFMQLVDAPSLDIRSRQHFFALASRAMRRILVDQARLRSAGKRPNPRAQLSLDEVVVLSPERDEDVLALDDALARLELEDPLQAEIVGLRFFGGLGVQTVADTLGLSKRRVEREWTMIKAWLRRELERA